MKNIVIIISLILQTLFVSAQTLSKDEYVKQKKEKLSLYKESVKREYDAFLEERNVRYAEFLSKQWEQYDMTKGEDAPIKPYPQKPIVKPVDLPNIEPLVIPIKNIVKIPVAKPVAPQFKPIAKEPKPQIPTYPQSPKTPVPPKQSQPQSGFTFNFIGSKLSVPLSNDHKFTLNGLKEGVVANAWRELSNGDMTNVVESCISTKDRLKLNDYLYVLMLDSMCNTFFGNNKHSEARLLKIYILTQSGYDVKCARCSAGLVMLLAIEEPIYQTSYLKIDGEQYYIVDEPKGSDHKYYTFSQKFSDISKSCSVRIEEEFVVNQNMTSTKKISSKRYPSISINVAVNKNLIELYDSYPRCKWDVYVKAPMSSYLSEHIMPKLRAEIAGKSEKEAANMIINFVQTAFDYKTDAEYFGYERSLFVDETFYYPYSDCEDRSILYANLIKNLLGADVVLLHYPNHLATAVRFKEEYKGDHVLVDGKKYLVCDPTYIGAEIGNAMPQFRSSSVEVVML